MLQKIQITNFKIIKNLRVDNLKRINLFGGKNNVGKTSFLEAIFSHYDRFSMDALTKTITLRGIVPVSITSPSKHEIWLPSFYGFDSGNTIHFQFTDEDRIEDSYFNLVDSEISDTILTREVNSTQSTKNRKIKKLHITATLNQEKQQEAFISLINEKFHHEIKYQKGGGEKNVVFSSNKLHDSTFEAIKFGELMKHGNEDVVVDALRLFEAELKSIVPIPMAENRTVLYGVVDKNKKIPLHFMGDGINHLLSYVTNIVSNPGGIVLIDEIENGFHHSIHERVWLILLEQAKRFDVQIFASTHSLEMVTALNKIAIEKYPNDFSYYELYSDTQTGHIKANNIESDVLEYMIGNSKEFRG